MLPRLGFYFLSLWKQILIIVLIYIKQMFTPISTVLHIAKENITKLDFSDRGSWMEMGM